MHDNELRVGNYVGNRVYQNWPPICIDGANIYNDYDLLIPIPITEKWLLDFGFNDFYGIRINLCGMEFDLTINKLGECCIYKPLTTNECPVIQLNNVFHVHQLQNLYFSLTGKELILKS